MKSYTDLEQSKKLAKILPFESADMHYNNASIKGINYVDEYRAELMDYNTAQKVWSKYLINPMVEVIPCWSLAALLSVLPNYQLQTQDDGIGILCSCNGNFNIVTADNPVDACYEIVIRLSELNLL